LSIPQGGGKTTICECLEVALPTIGIKVGVVSYDDFYLTNAEQRLVTSKAKKNVFLQGRGVAGTHDLELG